MAFLWFPMRKFNRDSRWFLDVQQASWLRVKWNQRTSYWCLSKRYLYLAYVSKDADISRWTGWISMTYSTDIHGSQMINPSDFGDLLTFPLATRADQNVHLSSINISTSTKEVFHTFYFLSPACQMNHLFSDLTFMVPRGWILLTLVIIWLLT